MVGMPDHDTSKALSDLIGGGTIAMFMTMRGSEHTSRPLAVAEVDGGRISFLVDRTVDWAAGLDAGTPVHVSVSDDRHNTYLSLQGTATITPDRDEIERLWNPGAAAYFDGQDDPAIGVLRFEVAGGEFWDSPSGRIGAAISMLRAAVSGDPGGESGSVRPA